VDDVLLAALEPVLRDLHAGALKPRVEDGDWAEDADRPSAMLWSRGGSGRGVAVERSSPAAVRAAELADQVQEWAIEELWHTGRPTNWPRCPAHPDSHPMRALVRESAAWWTCPADDTAVVAVGAVPPDAVDDPWRRPRRRRRRQQ
jgi:hypothetical protein